MPTKRSARKPPRSTDRRTYTEDERDAALDVVRDEGVAAAHDAFGIPKPTLSRWAKAAHIDTGRHARVDLAVSSTALRAKLLRTRASTTDLLEAQILEAGTMLAEVARANAFAAELIAAADPEDLTLSRSGGTTDRGDFIVEFADHTITEAVSRAMALAMLPLQIRDAVGIQTRAIHDLQLLRGEATERGDLVVSFAGAIPRPDTAREPVDQARLAIAG